MITSPTAATSAVTVRRGRLLLAADDGDGARDRERSERGEQDGSHDASPSKRGAAQGVHARRRQAVTLTTAVGCCSSCERERELDQGHRVRR